MLAQTEVDKSGKSYYGETTLYLLSANGGFDSRIDLGKPALAKCPRIKLTLSRQGGADSRCHMVPKLEGIRCGVWLHAGQDNSIQYASYTDT